MGRLNTTLQICEELCVAVGRERLHDRFLPLSSTSVGIDLAIGREHRNPFHSYPGGYPNRHAGWPHDYCARSRANPAKCSPRE